MVMGGLFNLIRLVCLYLLLVYNLFQWFLIATTNASINYTLPLEFKYDFETVVGTDFNENYTHLLFSIYNYSTKGCTIAGLRPTLISDKNVYGRFIAVGF